MFWTVMMFWGDEMGEAIPPTLDARAIPIIKQGPNDDLCGKVLKIDYSDQIKIE
jgi:hypothetical protein